LMLAFFTSVTYIFLIVPSMAQATVNVTIDGANEAIIYNPPKAWDHDKGQAAHVRHDQTTSSRTANSTATFRFNGTGIWWMTDGLQTNESNTVTLDGSTYNVSLYMGKRVPKAVLWGRSNLSSDREHTVVVNNPFGSPVHVDAFIVEQPKPPAPRPRSFLQTAEVQNVPDSKRDDNGPGLIAGLTISAFLVGMLFAFLICYIHHSRRLLNRENQGRRSRITSTTILPFVSPRLGLGLGAGDPTMGTGTGISRNASPQSAIPWDADQYAEGRDRLVDLVGVPAPRSQRRYRALYPNYRSAGSYWQSIGGGSSGGGGGGGSGSGSGTVMTESNPSSGDPSSPLTAALSSYFYAPSTMPSVRLSRIQDRRSTVTE